VEAIDDVALGDVRDRGLCLEEATSVGVWTLIPELFALGQVVAVAEAL